MNKKSRREALALVGAGTALFCLGCQKQPAAGPDFALPRSGQDRSRDCILILLPPEKRVLGLVEPLGRELEADFNVQFEAIAKGASEADVEKLAARHGPRLVVLLNNPTVHLYGGWARKQQMPPASLILMASFATELVGTLPNSTAISWEVPVATSVQGLRGLGFVVKRVGVLYRRGFARQIERERVLARPERAEFVTQELGDHPSSRELKAAIVRLRGEKVDALWIPNDNGLLGSEYLTQVWAPYLQHFGAPVIVGVPSLVRADLRLGSYAASPDLGALGVQAADRIFDIAEAGWRIPAVGSADVPLSVKTYLSARAISDFDIDKTKLGGIDYVIDQSEGR